MLENIWRYSLNDRECGGIVIANSQEEAEWKIREMYEDWDGNQESEEDILKVWKAVFDDDYSKDYPDVLEIY